MAKLQIPINEVAEEIFTNFLAGYASLVEGKHGIGKSETNKHQLTELFQKFFKLKYAPKTMDMRPSESDAAEIAGYPRFIEVEGRPEGKLVYTYPEWWDIDEEKNFFIVLIDELTHGTNLTQKPLYKLLDSGMVHQLKIPMTWCIVACCNPDTEEYVHVSYPMADLSFASRFMMISAYSDLSLLRAFWAGKSNQKFKLDFLPELSTKETIKKMMEWRQVTHHPFIEDFLVKFPAEIDRKRNCPRSFTRLSRLLTVIEDLYKDQKTRASMLENKAGSLLEDETVTLLKAFYLEKIKETLTGEEVLKWTKSTQDKVQKLVEGNRYDVIRLACENITGMIKEGPDKVQLTPARRKHLVEYLLSIPREIMYGWVSDIVDLESSCAELIGSLAEENEDFYNVLAEITGTKEETNADIKTDTTGA